MGDSLYMIARYNKVIRDFEIFYKSQDQSHRFNHPYQLGTNGDNINLIIENCHCLIDKDVIILATDG